MTEYGEESSQGTPPEQQNSEGKKEGDGSRYSLPEGNGKEKWLCTRDRNWRSFRDRSQPQHKFGQLSGRVVTLVTRERVVTERVVKIYVFWQVSLPRKAKSSHVHIESKTGRYD